VSATVLCKWDLGQIGCTCNDSCKLTVQTEFPKSHNSTTNQAVNQWADASARYVLGSGFRAKFNLKQMERPHWIERQWGKLPTRRSSCRWTNQERGGNAQTHPASVPCAALTLEGLRKSASLLRQEGKRWCGVRRRLQR
jgi:hypothetical protein